VSDLLRPVHALGLVALGLWLIDNMELTELARRCTATGRWAFFFAMLPWRMVGVTSSATNPIAMF
jgi:hypothetical protein